MAKGSTATPVAENRRYQNRIVGYGEDRPANLLANPFNAKIHPAFQQEMMKGSLESVGWVQNVIVNKRTGHVVDGHMRVLLAMDDNNTPVPITYIDVSEEEEKILLATYDPITGKAALDQTKLADLMRDIGPKIDARLGVLLGELHQTFADAPTPAPGLFAPTPAQSATFLDPLVNGEEGEDTASDYAAGAPDPARRDDYVQLSYACTPDQRATILAAVAKAKGGDDLMTSPAALAAVCRSYVEAH